jgi:hypothetical protein
MKNGLLDPAILSFVFAPLVITIALLFAILRRRMQGNANAPAPDAPERLLASAVGEMPAERRDWGSAMQAELGQVQDLSSRWRFALGCIRVALFPPRYAELLQPVLASRSPVCGLLAVTLPPMGLPFIYFAALIVEAIGGSPLTQSSGLGGWGNPDAVLVMVKIILLLTMICLVAGLPLGLAGWLRRERLRWLSALGMISSACIFAYFLTVMHFLAGGD